MVRQARHEVFDKLMKSNPLISLDLILSLSKDGVRLSDWQSLVTDLMRYAAASAAALALDYGMLLLLYQALGLGYLIAAAASYCCGLALIYGLSVRFVFKGRRAMRPREEILGFIVTGALGLLVNEALMGLFVGVFGLTVALAKVPTAGLVFLFNFATRRAFLFAPRFDTSARPPGLTGR